MERHVTISNLGVGVVRVLRLGLTGHEALTATFDRDGDGGQPPVVLHPGQANEPQPPVELEAGQSLDVTITCAPLLTGSVTGALTVRSDTPPASPDVEVPIAGRAAGPCINVQPTLVDFGVRPVGWGSVQWVWIENCDSVPVKISSMALSAASSPAFALDVTGLPGLFVGGAPSATTPLFLPGGEQAELTVRYVPTAESALDEGGLPILDTGTIVLEAVSYQRKVQIPVQASAAPFDCPVAVASVAEGASAAPQTTLHLLGDASFAPSVPIGKWQWSVDQPPGSSSELTPGPGSPNPTFVVDVVGTYRFRLRVWSEDGEPDCSPTEVKVVVVPPEGIRVELMWETPADPDPTDEGAHAGSDMDLHFVHPYASGPGLDGDGKPDGWFDQPSTSVSAHCSIAFRSAGRSSRDVTCVTRARVRRSRRAMSACRMPRCSALLRPALLSRMLPANICS